MRTIFASTVAFLSIVLRQNRFIYMQLVCVRLMNATGVNCHYIISMENPCNIIACPKLEIYQFFHHMLLVHQLMTILSKFLMIV